MRSPHLVIETAFSDDERGLASISQHLCPAALATSWQQLAGSVDVHITHIKPGEGEAVMSEIAALGTGASRRAACGRRRNVAALTAPGDDKSCQRP